VNLVRAEAVEGFCCGAKEGARGEDRNDCGVRCERSNRWCAGAGGTRRCAINPIVEKNPHRRFNPLKQDWVLVSPNRTQRPWQGQTEKPIAPAALDYDPDCYLCPGNMRAGGARTDKYTGTYVFENDYAALKLDAPRFSNDEGGKGLLVAEGESGVCRVICFSPRHDLTLAKMFVEEIRAAVDVWSEQYVELGARDDIGYVQIFENRGAMMGASNPHGQIWASRSVPNEVVAEFGGQQAYWLEKHEVLLCAYLANAMGVNIPNGSFMPTFILPLLRSATIRTFMVGFELLGGPRRDITPESAAETLRRAKARISAANSIFSQDTFKAWR
jgi:galactose-1-phosphate uridylyltransferase